MASKKTPKVKIAGLTKKRTVPRDAPKFVSVAGAGKAPSTSPINQFRLALDDPFCAASFGAKVPDEYSLPTEATTLRHRYTVSGFNAGDYVLVTPHPIFGSLALPGGSSTSAPTLNSITGTSGSTQVNAVVGNLLTYNYASPVGSTLANVYASYRVVGWGFRLRNITAAQNVAGDVSIAILPTCGTAPTSLLSQFNSTILTATTGGAWYELQRWCSLPTTVYGTASGRYGSPTIANVDSLGSCETYSAAELAQTGGVVVKPKVNSPGTAWSFRPTSTVTSNGAAGSVGSNIAAIAATQGAAGNNYTVFDGNFLNTAGHNAGIIVFGQGTGQTYEVEVIYHLETIPVANTSTGVVPTAYTSSPVVPRSVFDRTLDMVWRSPFMEFVRHEGESAMNSMRQALPGLLTKAAMMALT